MCAYQTEFHLKMMNGATEVQEQDDEWWEWGEGGNENGNGEEKNRKEILRI